MFGSNCYDDKSSKFTAPSWANSVEFASAHPASLMFFQNYLRIVVGFQSPSGLVAAYFAAQILSRRPHSSVNSTYIPFILSNLQFIANNTT